MSEKARVLENLNEEYENILKRSSELTELKKAILDQVMELEEKLVAAREETSAAEKNLQEAIAGGGMSASKDEVTALESRLNTHVKEVMLLEVTMDQCRHQLAETAEVLERLEAMNEEMVRQMEVIAKSS